MISAATTSPFMMQERDTSPWLLWTQKEPVFQLLKEKPTDRRSVSEGHLNDETAESPVPVPVQPIIPQTNRYHAVLSRMEMASKKAAAFSAWSN